MNYESQPENEALEHCGFEELKSRNNDHIIEIVLDGIENEELREAKKR